jgi:ribosomal-protein-alanine N-acetyltransferase
VGACNKSMNKTKEEFLKEIEVILFDPRSQIDILVDIDKKCFGESEAYGKKDFWKLYYQGSESFYVIKHSEKIIAYISAYINEDKYTLAVNGVIASIAVLDEYRGKGLAPLLINKILAQYKKLKVFQTFLHVKISNTTAFKLYEKLGFSVVEVLPNYYHKEDGYLMAIIQSDDENKENKEITGIINKIEVISINNSKEKNKNIEGNNNNNDNDNDAPGSPISSEKK